METEKTTHSPEETAQMGRELARHLRPGEVVLLYGDLGSGKSVFARGLIRSLPGGENATVRSPTFTLVHHHATKPPVIHADFYRLPAEIHPDDTGLLEFPEGTEEGYMLIEWPRERGPGRFPVSTRVTITSIDEKRRRVRIERR